MEEIIEKYYLAEDSKLVNYSEGTNGVVKLVEEGDRLMKACSYGCVGVFILNQTMVYLNILTM